MFSYYGSKSKVVDYYPPPKFNKIIEPFAGSARYSLKYFKNEVTLIDKNEIIIGVWNYLKSCSFNDIMSLPTLEIGDSIEHINFDCLEQKWLMGFLISNGAIVPSKTMSKWGFKVFQKQRNDIACNLFKIKHWNIKKGDYSEIKNERATWFIDPPYFVGGHKYKFGSQKIDYKHLSNWCKNRNGQIIVCENTNASWMEFKPIKRQRGVKKTTTEAIWSNHKTNYDAVQQTLPF
jgi:site-specific DNA-adenine methylase